MPNDTKAARKMPKGGRKGGAVFPRHTLEEALPWAKKLVSKTHSGSQPQDVIFSGVVGAKSGIGNVRVSALKQYGLLNGSSSEYMASDLAKRINASPEDELENLYKLAALQPSVFKQLFNTFQSDEVTKGKLKQRAADLKIHPDETERCVDVYVSTMKRAGLISVDGDKILHSSAIDLNASNEENGHSQPNVGAANERSSEESEPLEGKSGEIAEISSQADNTNVVPPTPRAIFHVNVTLDSSLDTEKLAKQLDLLKRFGAI
jgi:hypothetical protein